MAESDRGGNSSTGLIATVTVAIIGIALYWSMFHSMGYSSGYHEGQAEISGQHYASDTANQIDRECGTKSGQAARECIADIVKAEREGQRNESDLAAQWKAADWVMWAGILAGFQLIATVLGLYFVKRTLDATLEAVEETGRATDAMKEQNKNFEKSSRDQQRAYVGVESAQIVINGWSIKLIANVKNFGSTPARNVSLEMGLKLVVSGRRTTDRSLMSEKVEGGTLANSLGEMPPGGINKTDWIGWTNAVIGLPNLYKDFVDIEDIEFLPIISGYLTWTTVFGENEHLFVNITFENFVEDRTNSNRRFTGTGIIYHGPAPSIENDDGHHHEG